jgi:hypothetical protein
MSNIKTAAAPVAPVPIAAPVSLRELVTILIKHYDLHEGRYDLLVEYQIGVGPVGPDPASVVPGVMFGFGKVGLLKAMTPGPTSVDAAEVNPAPILKKRARTPAAKAVRTK